ncbi:uncharacterized protein LOC110404423 [Numida meleagris]|uniref:uncharacterized protein LOC110404423 n=1 Tax=Numida meleagris TaxID=8996 RepID=UPI000B3DB9CD|nr:uncharacterized protein LOC110404423 [Numida meleagris]
MPLGGGTVQDLEEIQAESILHSHSIPLVSETQARGSGWQGVHPAVGVPSSCCWGPIQLPGCIQAASDPPPPATRQWTLCSTRLPGSVKGTGSSGGALWGWGAQRGALLWLGSGLGWHRVAFPWENCSAFPLWPRAWGGSTVWSHHGPPLVGCKPWRGGEAGWAGRTWESSSCGAQNGVFLHALTVLAVPAPHFLLQLWVCSFPRASFPGAKGTALHLAARSFPLPSSGSPSTPPALPASLQPQQCSRAGSDAGSNAFLGTAAAGHGDISVPKLEVSARSACSFPHASRKRNSRAGPRGRIPPIPAARSCLLGGGSLPVCTLCAIDGDELSPHSCCVCLLFPTPSPKSKEYIICMCIFLKKKK